MIHNMTEQLSIFSLMPQIHVGDFAYTHGKELDWNELEQKVGGGLVVVEEYGLLRIAELVAVSLNSSTRRLSLLYRIGQRERDIYEVYKTDIIRRKAYVRFYEV